MPDFNILIDRALQRWMTLTIRYHSFVIALMIVASALSLFYTLNNLTVNTDTRDMLSRDLDWRQQDMAYETAFPMYVDNIVVVIEAPTPDQAADAAADLGARLKEDTTHYQEIFQPSELEFFRHSALLYLDAEELQALSDRLAHIQPLLGQLVADQTLHGLFQLLRQAIDARRDGSNFDLRPLLKEINALVEAANQGEQHYLSWQNLIAGADTGTVTSREFILVKPNIDYSSLLAGEAAIKAIRDTIRTAELDTRYAANVRLTGGAVLAYEELASVSKGAGIAAFLALVVVTFILIVGLRSIRMVFASVITLLCGLLLTAGMATATVGELNLISVAFAVLYIGLGSDFVVHFCMRFYELHTQEKIYKAMQLSAVSVGRSLFLCALTMAIGLYAFIPTSYSGIAELGWIAGTGMLISFLVTLTLLPALLAMVIPAGKQPHPPRPKPLLDRVAALPNRYAGTICLVSLVLALLATTLLTQMRFDANTLNLQAAGNESVQTFRDLLNDSNLSPLSGIIVTQDAAHSKELERRLERVTAVDDVRTLWDFIPANQPDKLAMIDNLSLLVGPTLSNLDNKKKSTAAERRQALTDLLDFLNENPPNTATEPVLAHFHNSLQQFNERLQQLPSSTAKVKLARLEEALLANLPGRLQSLRDALQAEPVSLESLPDKLRDRWLSPEGWYRIEIQPVAKLNSEQAMREFVTEVRQHIDKTDHLIGAPVIQLEAAESVVDAFLEAFILAFICITLILLIELRSVLDTVLALLPIVLATLLTAAATVVLDMPFNFANIIALPLLLGIGIDNSIHILHRYHRAPPGDGMLLRTAVSRAILISTLTNICGIGNLAFSAHAGTASMGLLLALGISLCLVCALLLLPSMLVLRQRYFGGHYIDRNGS